MTRVGENGLALLLEQGYNHLRVQALLAACLDDERLFKVTGG